MNESVSESFKREYPQHADKVSEMVHKWYHYGVNGYIVRNPKTLQLVTANFIDCVLRSPDEVLINGMPLSLALSDKRNQMLNIFRNITPLEYNRIFGDWFNENLSNDKNPGKRSAIEQNAIEHLCQWLGGLSMDLRQAVGVWNDVDINLTAFINKNTSNLHPVSIKLLESIQMVVFEQFMTDIYAPQDLFGNTLIL